MFSKIYVFSLLSVICLTTFAKDQDFGCPDDRCKQILLGGDIESMYKLGTYYLDQKKGEIAIPLLKKASDKGHAWAANDLGIAYTRGIGVKKNKTKANYYYELAAQRGDSVALYNIGEAYFLGIGYPQNYAKAKKYLAQIKVDNEAYGCAYYLLGIMYTRGLGVSVDKNQAKDYFTQSARFQIVNFLESYNKKQQYSSGLLFTDYALSYSDEMLQKYKLNNKTTVNLSRFTRDYDAFLIDKCLGEQKKLFKIT